MANQLPKPTEHNLTFELKKKMDDSGKFERVYAWKRPSRSSTFMSRWFEIHGGTLAPPVQPDMDLIVFWQDLVIGVEVKYFKRRAGKLATSFYEGLDQAIALLGWGFDRVALWQLYEESVTGEELWFYGVKTWVFVQAPVNEGGLGLPIEFTLMRVSRQANGYEFTPFNPIVKEGRPALQPTFPLYHPRFQFHARLPNPLATHQSVRARREALLEWLQTQNP